MLFKRGVPIEVKNCLLKKKTNLKLTLRVRNFLKTAISEFCFKESYFVKNLTFWY